MSEAGSARSASQGDQQRFALMLRTWEAVSAERELHGVLGALADVLVPVVPFDSIAIIDFSKGLEAHDQHRIVALHVVGFPRIEGETPTELAKRTEPYWSPLKEVRPLIPYPSFEPGLVTGEPIACDDLLQKEGWYEHEFYLAQGGVRSYATVPLVATGRLIGVATFTRVQQRAFPAPELSVLQDVGRALSVAAANALANEEIRKLREQLEEENIGLRAQLGQAPWFEEILAYSAALKRVLETIEQVATTDATVLITGETGTGKELLARAIHRRSPRARGPFIKVNCAAIPDTLLASELFGHERGAFTGAIERRKGRFELAHGGTLFLDEVGELPPELQVMLLRVLQEREFERLGGGDTIHVDVRIVAATNRDLMEDVRAGRFRSDLYYRLNVFPLRLPPLRERPEDIPLLVAHFAAKHGERFGRAINRIDRRSMKLLEGGAWPGNVRELENVIERAIILSRDGVLRVERDALPHGNLTGSPNGNMDERLRAQERETIEAALRASKGRV